MKPIFYVLKAVDVGSAWIREIGVNMAVSSRGRLLVFALQIDLVNI